MPWEEAVQTECRDGRKLVLGQEAQRCWSAEGRPSVRQEQLGSSRLLRHCLGATRSVPLGCHDKRPPIRSHTALEVSVLKSKPERGALPAWLLSLVFISNQIPLLLFSPYPTSLSPSLSSTLM